MAKKKQAVEPKKEEPRALSQNAVEVGAEKEEFDGSYFPTSILPTLHDIKRCAELVKEKIVHRELGLGVDSLRESLDQAIRWAKNIEDVLADIEAKAKK